MPWRLLRRCLLFGLLGLVTAVAVAWGAAVRWQLAMGAFGSVTIGAAIVGDRPLSLIARSRLAIDIEQWDVRAAAPVTGTAGSELHDALLRFYRDHAAMWAERQNPATAKQRIDDDRAALGPRASLEDHMEGRLTITVVRAGWPLRALHCSVQRSGGPSRTARPLGPGTVDQQAKARSAIAALWPRGNAAAMPPAAATIYLPVGPRFGLAINTVFYALLWALLLLAPGAIRRRIRRARGRCAQCGYSLRGQPAPGCPECGQGREEVAKWQSGEVAE